MNAAARSGARGPSRSSTRRRSPPATNRIAMNSTPSASPASYTGMMCGSSTAAAARDSAMNRRRNAASAASAGARIFSATSRSSRWSRARNTTAIPPAPTCASSRYPASSEPARNPASAGKSSLNTPPRHRGTALKACGGNRQCVAQAVQVSARYGLTAKAQALRDLAGPWRATLLATARHLEAAAVDDALDLFDVPMVTRLISTARRASAAERLAAMPGLERASVTLRSSAD